MQSYDVTVCKMVRRPSRKRCMVCETKMIPHSSTVNVQVTKCRPVTEMVARQTSVCVPYQVPVTVMTTQTRPVVRPDARSPECARFVADGSEPARRSLSPATRIHVDREIGSPSNSRREATMNSRKGWMAKAAVWPRQCVDCSALSHLHTPSRR